MVTLSWNGSRIITPNRFKNQSSGINQTLTPNRFKNQTNDTLKLLGHNNNNHQRGFLKQKIVALHHCSFNLKLPKHCYFDCYFG